MSHPLASRENRQTHQINYSESKKVDPASKSSIQYIYSKMFLSFETRNVVTE